MSTMLTGRISLFNRVDYEIIYFWLHRDSQTYKRKVVYYHYCNPEDIPNRIEETGTCRSCGDYIAPYKRLDTILGLKELLT